ncbi:hypothetical protein NI392_17295 [Vibrio alginolyticus]|uniref:hypothetical protein n=1 Tax=Vibrio TaxID=662 RepID=UPI000E05D004|nr:MULTISPECIES: hypothetical protein [Vibrio]MDW1972780.1 hypothetical protein [Vibrio sp. 945]EIC9816385.1 hypothetical protein [Vibrio alginolyticus]EII5414536.1 hypothetical protein [Vibrio alginolyticus]EJL6726686.1 hypothetical protein [Vibrio alginolyticus]ELN6885370.1 hypothetical protein [Vibrio alginolyticus]
MSKNNKELDRLAKKVKELQKRNAVPPKVDNEPEGLLSGGPEHLDLDSEQEKSERNKK